MDDLVGDFYCQRFDYRGTAAGRGALVVGFTAQRQLVIKSLSRWRSACLCPDDGTSFPHDRPFVENIGYNFLHHAADDSFPSDHGTVIFTFALAFYAGIACGPAHF